MRLTSGCSRSHRIPDSGTFALAVLDSCPQVSADLPEAWATIARAKAAEARTFAREMGGFPKQTIDYEQAMCERVPRDRRDDQVSPVVRTAGDTWSSRWSRGTRSYIACS